MIVAADFCLRETKDASWPLRTLNRLAQGKVHEDLLKELRKKTEQAQAQEKNSTLVTIWAIHFPPYFPYTRAGRVTRLLAKLCKNLIGERSLIDAARAENVSAILAGHTHEKDDYEAGNKCRVLCAGTATQDDIADKHCQIIEITRNSIGQPKVVVQNFKQETVKSTFAFWPLPLRNRLWS